MSSNSYLFGAIAVRISNVGGIAQHSIILFEHLQWHRQLKRCGYKAACSPIYSYLVLRLLHSNDRILIFAIKIILMLVSQPWPTSMGLVAICVHKFLMNLMLLPARMLAIWLASQLQLYIWAQTERVLQVTCLIKSMRYFSL